MNELIERLENHTQNTSKRSVQHPLLDDIDQALAAIVSVVARNTIELS
ncbi:MULTISPECIES: hypothetical protein [Shewanella]|nr:MULTISPECIES: hypothetical protein [Shewanella]MCU8009749.1 hypothetical protein [Shewanella sp. SM87]MCU8020865.1 hypothetical protein [Shewanella sp. SM78]MCU8035412.1 hypothetical protein [Shewanella sp. SM71]MCU8043671.1 hypothetical protein [Shewanella sp. SM68]MCU8047754.1 hypothetical protein [Shewanella sp. SM65]